MIIETKFNLGDKVLLISYTVTEVKKRCPECDGTGRWDLVKGGSILCNACSGKGNTISWGGKSWKVGETRLTVGQVRVQVTKCKATKGMEHFGNFSAQEGYVEEYMMVESGVGSGSVYKAEDLFMDMKEESEASKECKRRNALEDN